MLTNLCLFLDAMNAQQWHMASFLYSYNGVRTAVSVEDLYCFEPNAPRTICRLTFFDLDDEARRLVTEASKWSFQVNVRDIKDFFRVGYKEDIRGFLEDFYSHFDRNTPPVPAEEPTEAEESAIKKCYQSHGENPYTNCYGIIHNRDNGQRRLCNEEKAKRYAFEVYEHYKNDTNISFCFHEGPPATLAEIVARSAI